MPVTDPLKKEKLRVAASGIAAASPKTVFDVLARTVAEKGDAPALRSQVPEKTGPWVTTTFSQYDQEARAFALGLLAVARGAGARDFRPCVSVMAHNMPRWHFASLGALMANHLSAGIYLTNGPGATRYVLAHSRSTVCVVGTKKELDTVLAACALPEGGEGEGGALHVSHVVVMDPTWSAAGGGAGGSGAGGPTVLDWDAFVDLGKSVSLAELEASMGAQEPGTPCVLIYTSGTTSHPKAVMLSHDNLTWTSEAILKRVNEDTPTGPGSGYTFGSDEVYISYLPLSHIAAQILDIYIPLAIAAEVCFARPDALRGTLGDTLKEVRPTMFFAVPRVWEKIQEKMVATGRANKGLKKAISTWARGVGTAASRAAEFGSEDWNPWGYWLADKLVFSAVRGALGLDRCRLFATGAAPIRMETMEFFQSLDIRICNAFGMSESTGAQTCCVPGANRSGSCGRLLDGVEMKLVDDATGRETTTGEGEICFRGRHVMCGYMYNDEATSGAIDSDGWLHSGDVGRVDADGFLHITGRIKELIITAGGENVPPVLIEDLIKDAAPFVSNVMVIGDKRKFLTCVVTLHVEVHEGEPTDKLAGATLLKLKDLGSTATTVAEARGDAKLKKAIEDAIVAANKKATSNAQTVKKFEILPAEFSVGGGELTATQKLKRRVVNDKYTDLIESMYDV